MNNKFHTLRPTIVATLALFWLSPLSIAAPAEQHMVELVSPDVAERKVAQPVAQPVLQRDVYGPISQTDTLWSIASQYRPSNDVTVNQVTVAIYRLNPHAFKGGDINAIIAGGAIRIPSEDDIKKISHNEAVKILSAKQPVPQKIKPEVSTRIDGKRVVKFSPKGTEPAKPVIDAVELETVSLEQYKTLNAEFAQVSALLKKQNIDIKEYQLTITTLEKELAIKSKIPISAKASSNEALVLEQQKVLLLTEQNHSLKMKRQEFDTELVELKSQLEAAKAQVDELQKQLAQEISKQQVVAEPEAIEAPQSENLYSQLVSEPLNLLMMVVVYTLLLLVVVVVILRIRGKKEIDEQEKDLAESPMGVMGEDESEFDSLLAEELEASDSFDEFQTADELDDFANFEEPQGQNKFDESFPDLNDALADLELTTENDAQAVDQKIEPELDLDDFDDIELSDFDQMDDAPDLVPAPNLETFSTKPVEEELDLVLDFDNTDESELEALIDSDEVAPLEFTSKSVASEEPELVIELAEPEPEFSLDFDSDINLEPELELDLAELGTAIPESRDVKDKEFVDIEKLMEGSEYDASDTEPYDAPSLDVGLDDFPDLLSEHQDIDVDADISGVSTQLDLARAYLEIDDKSGAKAILDEVLNKGNESQVAEASALLAKIG